MEAQLNNSGPRLEGGIRGLSDWTGLQHPALVYLKHALAAPRDTLYTPHKWRIAQDILEASAAGGSNDEQDTGIQL
jgi:hypothetical protein